MAQDTYKNALVTGASSGLGRGLSAWLARQGIRVYAAARREPQLRALQEEARAVGAQVEAVPLDVSDARATIERIRALDQECGGLDLVVANAGVGPSTNARSLKWENVEQIIQVNVLGAAATLSAVLPLMVERGRGHLVGISSIAALRGLPKSAAYSASKAFLSTFLEGLRIDLRGSGVKVTAIHPGFVKTEMTAQNRFPMPWMLETDDAVDRIGRAILRGDRQLFFPWQLSAVARLLRAAPAPLYEALAGKMRGKN